MKELDKNYVYSLKELTSEERNKLSVTLGFNILNYSFLYYGVEKGWYCTNYNSSKAINLHNAKDLFERIPDVGKTISEAYEEEVFNPQQHYFNELKQFRSLFELSHILELNEWEFDILKRLVRCRKKGQFSQDIQKIKDTADIYLTEFKEKENE